MALLFLKVEMECCAPEMVEIAEMAGMYCPLNGAYVQFLTAFLTLSSLH